ncbi:MAG: hypothetical protein ACTHKV_01215, partial [Flavipsychrobacter sp.]
IRSILQVKAHCKTNKSLILARMFGYNTIKAMEAELPCPYRDKYRKRWRFKDREAKPQHVVVKYNYSLEGQRAYLLDYMKSNTRVAFETIYSQCETRIHAIFTFLAMLELIQQRFLGILIGTGRNNFIVEWNTEQEMLENQEESEDLPSFDNPEEEETDPLA